MKDSILKSKDIWEIPCPVMDTILMVSYDSKELLNICSQCHITIDNENRQGCDLDHHVYLEVHRHCHQSCPLSRYIQKQLNKRYEKYILGVRECPWEEILDIHNRFLTEWAEHHASGLLWAICTDPREELRKIERSLQYRIQVTAHNKLSCA